MDANSTNRAETGKAGNSGRKLAYAIAIVAAVIVASVAYVFLSMPAVAASGDTVSVFYTGSFSNGTVFNTNVGGAPFNFTIGTGQVINGFNDGVIGMRVGEIKNITVTPSQGYGYVNQSLIISYPINDFGNDSLSAGEFLQTTSGQTGRITSINSTNVTVDFNPLLAGQTLIFQIELVAVHKG